MRPGHHTCGVCGYLWNHGASGDHNCSDRLVKQIKELQPEQISVDKEVLIAALKCITNSMETVICCLQDHDATLGRKTKKNKLWAELLESDIAELSLSKSKLREAVGYDIAKENKLT